LIATGGDVVLWEERRSHAEYFYSVLSVDGCFRCGHCKALTPKYEHLARIFEGEKNVSSVIPMVWLAIGDKDG